MATVKLPTQLRAAAGGAAEAQAPGTTVGEVLEALYAEHGELRERISDSDGTLRRFVNVYLRGEDIRFLDGLDTEVGESDEVTILPAVAGGAKPLAAAAARGRGAKSSAPTRSSASAAWRQPISASIASATWTS